ncbi:hypothetical protein [Cellvibrio sp. OA-2007]|uniref:hypothetical protein n=1 Tax=Cellvibrio sp. OA-2007 TaxID=529823 RepID=UPI000782B955|nr:hypothetical protein [Cellvibrio sp. OA-2007]
MNIWFFIILIVVIALVIGPISMLKPSPGQKRKEQLRTYASTRGVRFSMRKLPPLKTDMDQPATLPVYYLPPPSKIQEVPEWILMRTPYVHESNFYLAWDWQTDVRPSVATCDLLRVYLPQLPESVPAISCGNMGICIFWQEKEAVETLDRLIEMLRGLHQTEYQPADSQG